MNPADYKSERQRRGTLKGVAALLGKHWTTIARRESGEITFDREMWLALCSLPLRKPKRSCSALDAGRIGAPPESWRIL